MNNQELSYQEDNHPEEDVIPQSFYHITIQGVEPEIQPTKIGHENSMMQPNAESLQYPPMQQVTNGGEEAEVGENAIEMQDIRSQQAYSVAGSYDNRNFLTTPPDKVNGSRKELYVNTDPADTPRDSLHKLTVVKIKSKISWSQQVFWWYMGLVGVFGLVSLIVTLSVTYKLSSFNSSESRYFTQETLAFWKKKYILDIIVTKSTSCPTNFEEGLDYLWPGTSRGCACPYVDNAKVQTYIVNGSCNSELLSLDCFDVISNDAQYIRFWRNGQRICVRRDTTYTFFNSPTSCTSSSTILTKCGTGETAVCIPIGQECPVSYVQSQSTFEDIVGTLESQILQIDTSVQFSFETRSSHYPLSSFRIDEYSHCEHSTRQQISISKRGDYVLMNSQRRFCSVNDTRPNALDMLGEETLFKANPTLWAVLSSSTSLPAYPRPSDSFTWVLGSMPYPAWAMSCRSSELYSMVIVEERFTLEKETINQTHMLVTTLISVLVVSLILVVIEIKRRITRSADVEFYKSEKFYDARFSNSRFIRPLYPRQAGWVKTTYIILGVHWGFRILNIPSLFISYVRIRNSIDWFGKTVSLSCSDTFYKENISTDYQNSLSQLRDYYAVLLIFWWILFVIDILYLSFTYFYEILPAKEEEYLTELIVKGGDQQEIIPMMHRSRAHTRKEHNEEEVDSEKSGRHLHNDSVIHEEDDENQYDDENRQ